MPYPYKACRFHDGTDGHISAQFGPTGDVGKMQIYFSDKVIDKPVARHTWQLVGDTMLDGRGDRVAKISSAKKSTRIGGVKLYWDEDAGSTFLVTDWYQTAGRPMSEQPWFPSESLVRTNLRSLGFSCHVPKYEDLTCNRDRWGIDYDVTKVADTRWLAYFKVSDEDVISAAGAMRYTGKLLHYAGLSGQDAQRLIDTALATGKETFRGYADGYEYTITNYGTDKTGTTGSIRVQPTFGTNY